MSGFKSLLKKSRLAISIRKNLMMNIFKRNKIKNNGLGNKIIKNNAIILSTKITFIGHNNTIMIGDNCHISDFNIFIQGNNNRVEILNDCVLKGSEFWFEDNFNVIKVGKGSTFEIKTQLACIEGCSITIGDDCMFSSNIAVCTGDSHSIINMLGKRINPSMDINIGNKVWVGSCVKIMKGANIPNHTIIGTGSLVNKKFEKEQTIIAGFPAKVIKENIDWNRKRL